MVRWLLIFSLSFNVLANKPDHQKKPQPKELEVSLAENPIKKTDAVFIFDTPAGFEIDRARIVIISGNVKYKLKTESIVLKTENGKTTGTIPVSNLAPGDYQVRVRLKDKKSKDEIFTKCRDRGAKILKDSLTMTIDSSLEVPDPGEEGKKTLAGIDSDNNGVRDDVQRWINETHPNKPSTKQALSQQAKATQLILKNSSNGDFLRTNASKELGYSIECLSWITKNFVDLSKELDVRVVNSEGRVKARLESESHLSGVSAPREIVEAKWGERSKFCNFSATKE